MAGIMLWIVIVSSVIVYFDARSIGAAKGVLKGFFNLSPTGWFFSCLFLWIIGFPAYLMKREEIRKNVIQKVVTPVAQDTLAQIEKLIALKTKGHITEAEFEILKKKIIVT